MFGPAALPRPVLVRLNQASNRILREPAVREQFARQGLEVQTMTSDQFAAILRSDVGKWGKIIRDVGVRAD
jgi:tripartite-type tricarboxylate transporter receptor subunit TctC